MSNFLKQTLTGLSNLIAPRVCAVCGGSLAMQEDIMCIRCNADLPRTGVHTDAFNVIHKRLGHKCVVERAAGWFWYVKGNPYTRLLLDAKYMGLHRQAFRLGSACAAELQRDRFFDGIDALVPMPMHWVKELRRGYNQAVEICLGMAEVTGIDVVEAVVAIKPHGVQSRHKRSSRFSNISGTMKVVDPAAIAGRHILIVDDIITTGASIAEAIRAVSAAAPAATSVLSLGLTV